MRSRASHRKPAHPAGSRRLGIGLAIAAGVLFGGCACLIEEGSALSQVARAESEPPAARRTRAGPHAPAPIAARPVQPSLDPSLLVRVEAPRCAVEGAGKPAPESGEPGSSADPNLVEIARLQLERDCYRDAEAAVRRQLDRLQSAAEPGD